MKTIYIIAILIITISLLFMMVYSKTKFFPIVSSESFITNITDKSIDNKTETIVNNIFKRPTINNIACIFKDSELCKNKSCVGIDWNNPIGASDECKKIVNSYCRIEKNDKGCMDLKIWKKNQEKINKSMVKIEHPAITNQNDCKSCSSKIDLTKFTMAK